MNDVFLVFGYGVPKDILKDENYNFYLKMVFNKIYDFVVKNNIEKPIIIFCGGETDVLKPYKRNEADEMIKFFTTLINERPFLKSLTRNWLFISEKDSLSTLENLINSKKIVIKRKIKKANFYVFCEQTRERRIKVLAKKIFDKNYNFLVVPIDFDVSANRYLPIDYLAKKESAELKHSLWALQSPENLKKHHKVFEEKFEYFRKVGHKAHVNAVKEWWDQKLKELKN
ncbi:hypothetical protein KKA13_00180 [Patescibacteria group bacterium]|nr:hypothetical protein [Patescibacteria group bacterium]